eukprot:CAMPEP_0197691046 /NCGR_PEP_ID=MMETSP1338-20131121/109181_1 /TAXON_ID=43686 ORGANISM="Pelagodinium beii, Strain RCC1491" /NCGR_SAMPLE_ID=MMETSP1338 /ASSEMBLY_ACC=CAM_ASM_000754 /LENGTH=246 /DNA_ID=CAMNT_0043273555 /DNA_START=31 /DNA_END=767 /DNA_ORIENTATION=+
MVSSWLPADSRWKVTAAALAVGLLAFLAEKQRRKRSPKAVVTDIHRFAVKGLERDSLQSCKLGVGCSLPSDRTWALMRVDKTGEFDDNSPQWVHKMSFFAACSAGRLLAQFGTAYDDESTKLRIWEKITGAQLLEARLDTERSLAEQFFTDLVQKEELTFNDDGGISRPQGVRIVRALPEKPFQFGNTNSGMKASGNVRTIHIVNAATVRALCRACGEDIDILRFRGNLLIAGLPAWEEFSWVGRT